MKDNLFEKIVKNTGLPEDLVSQEFLKQINSKGLDKNNLTIEQIRDVLSEYLQDVLLQAQEEYK
jgi:hypothetical protein